MAAISRICYLLVLFQRTVQRQSPGSKILENPQALADTKLYFENIARWLAL